VMPGKEMVREHNFIDGVCRWCGGRDSEFLVRALTCVPRFVDAPSRSTPSSIFADLGAIGERLREIQVQEKPSEPKDGHN
jgi:hypothetical protein